MYFQDKISGPGTLPTSTSYISRYHFIMTFFGILLTFTPMHFLGFNVMPRRIPDFPDYFNSWNLPVINCNTIDIPSKKPIFQKELMLLGHGYDCK